MKEIVKSTRGTVHQYNDDSMDFKPYGKGEPVYDHSHKVGDSTLGRPFYALVTVTRVTLRPNFWGIKKSAPRKEERSLC